MWTTDKNGITAALLAEITALERPRPGRDLRRAWRIVRRPGGGPATPEQKARLTRLSGVEIHIAELAGESIQTILTEAPGNGASIGGLKVVTKNGWSAARPSGTEDTYKVYAESFLGAHHLALILEEAQKIVGAALAKDG